MEKQCTLSTDEFIELLIELDALQRLFNVWLEESHTEEVGPQMEILKGMITKKVTIRDQVLAEYRNTYPELEQFDWAKPDFDA